MAKRDDRLAKFLPLGNRRRKASMASLSPPLPRKIQKVELKESQITESFSRAQEKASGGMQGTDYFESSEYGMIFNNPQINGEEMPAALERLKRQQLALQKEGNQHKEAIRQSNLKKTELKHQHSSLKQELEHRKPTLQDNKTFLNLKRMSKEENERFASLEDDWRVSDQKLSVLNAQSRLLKTLEAGKQSRRKSFVADAKARLIKAQEDLQKAKKEAAAAEIPRISGSAIASNSFTGHNLRGDSARVPQATPKKNKRVKRKGKKNRGLPQEDPMSDEDYLRAFDIKLEQNEDSGFLRSFPVKGATLAETRKSLEQLEAPRITLAHEPRETANNEEEMERRKKTWQSRRSRLAPVALEPGMMVQPAAGNTGASEFSYQSHLPQQSSTSVGFSSYAEKGLQPFGDRGHQMKSEPETSTTFSGFSRDQQAFGSRAGERDLRQVNRSGSFHYSAAPSLRDVGEVTQDHLHQNQSLSAPYFLRSTQGLPIWGPRGTPESALGNIGFGNTSHREYHNSGTERPDFLGSYAITQDPMPPHINQLPEAKGRKGQPRQEISPLPKPVPTHQYVAQAKVPPKCAEEANDILVVIDLNGTLLHRPIKKQPKRYVARPCVEKFLYYITKTHNVVVWSSARPRNVQAICDRLFKQYDRSSLITVWGRDKFKLTNQQYDAKIQVYKDLEQVWKDPKIASKHPGAAAGKKWNQSNTVLIDDSIEKGSAQPYNILEVPEFNGQETERESPLQAVAGYLENLRWQEDVSAFMREQPFKVDEKWKLGWMIKEKLPSYLVAPPSIDVPDREPSIASSRTED